jgi:hypothetical protein
MSRVMPSRMLVGATVAAAAVAGLSLSAPANAVMVLPRATQPTLAMGASGTVVKSLQRTLAITQTGVYDKKTYAAVKRIQVWKKISPANGVVGAATWTAVADPTLSKRMLTSPTARRTMTLAQWRTSVHGYGISYREAKLTCTAVSPAGLYRGKWQMSAVLWKAYGGLRFAKTANTATCLQQDTVAFKVWQSNGWKPWGG